MPIRREWRHLYRGAEWKAIRARILERAQNCCERCGVPNRETVLRQHGWWTPTSLAATVWANHGQFRNRRRRVYFAGGAKIENAGKVQFIHLPWGAADQNGKPFIRMACFPNIDEHRWVRIVLTIAHLNHDPRDNRDENLQALCQWCHLHHDVRFHHANARRTRARKAGQSWLEGMESTA